jgi:hypothetical protein
LTSAPGGSQAAEVDAKEVKAKSDMAVRLTQTNSAVFMADAPFLR